MAGTPKPAPASQAKTLPPEDGPRVSPTARTVRCTTPKTLQETLRIEGLADEPARAPEAPEPERARYQDLGEIGRGGMGSVHRTFDRLLLREIAMKTIDRPLRDAATALRFVEEAQITGQLDHPNIVPVYDFGTRADRQAFFTMKLVSGRTLSELITDLHDAGFPSDGLEQLLRMILKVCEAVSFAHSRGVVHRDLKPANIMIGSHGQVYVMDWGLGLLLGAAPRAEPSVGSTSDSVRTSAAPRSGPSLAGTVGYMAPEQASGRIEAIGPRTDVFAIGAILYEVLTGRPPYQADDLHQALALARSGKIAAPQEVAEGRPLPPGLCEIAMKALQPALEDRYSTVDDLSEEVEGFLRGGGWFATRRYRAGQRVIEEGGPADAAYVIVEGRCEVYKQRADGRSSIRTLGPGDVFGEAALLSAKPRTATVAALDNVTVKVITAEAFQRELGRCSWLASLVKQLTSRFLDLESRLAGTSGAP
jgi:eukaryotic-like serine/threonine-protein kinase